MHTKHTNVGSTIQESTCYMIVIGKRRREEGQEEEERSSRGRAILTTSSSSSSPPVGLYVPDCIVEGTNPPAPSSIQPPLALNDITIHDKMSIEEKRARGNGEEEEKKEGGGRGGGGEVK